MKKAIHYFVCFILLYLIANATFAQGFCNQIAKDDIVGPIPWNSGLSFSLAKLQANDTEKLELADFPSRFLYYGDYRIGIVGYSETTKMFSISLLIQGYIGPVSFTYTLKKEPETRLGAPFIINGEEHYYEVIQLNAQLSWQDAMAQVGARSYNGQKGYLATVTSAEENQFIRQKLEKSALGSSAWLGASDAAEEGTWRWITGPEAGTPLNYSYWAPSAPNNAGEEDYLTMNLAGQWQDVNKEENAAAGNPVNLYVVEYGSSENCSNYLTATVNSYAAKPDYSPPCSLALTTKVTQAEPWYGMWGPVNGAGAIDLTVTGGNGSYTYQWNNGATTQDLGLVSPGYYTVTVTDGGSGCKASTTVYVGMKNDFLRVLSSHIDVTRRGAQGGSNGSIDVTVVGGVPPYTYAWVRGQTTEDLAGLNPGVQTVTVRDAIGQQATTSVYVSELNYPLLLHIDHQNVSAAGKKDGALDLTVSGGVGPYTYRWNTGATTEDLNYAIPGWYEVTVTDANFTTTTASVQVEVGRSPVIMLMPRNVSVAGQEDGSVAISVYGGVRPFTYRWNTGATTEGLHNVGAGWYEVRVTDANGVMSAAMVLIGVGRYPTTMARQPNATDILTPPAGFMVYPNPAADRAIVNFSLAAATKYTLEMYDIRGAKVKTLATGQAQANKALTVKVNLADYGKGVYLLKLQTDHEVSSRRLLIGR
ncbi:T9SS type A sorting domain-containing protein [Adhaeribacter rhizoryzae]|uniref:T9SS type A sorting domain-containing protein n=1 Tax=Adhaeribacter rhizoryzae TaxID=2607907 RepID=A0A5M6CXK8_9BACT|nr:T9SS type A sorting domain-containing protein [Adhaeribacter rhizoryzae]KAA5539958.1 T9SS type A sorting domain-containing protein [Adhaeribacter rhizoryzae]